MCEALDEQKILDEMSFNLYKIKNSFQTLDLPRKLTLLILSHSNHLDIQKSEESYFLNIHTFLRNYFL